MNPRTRVLGPTTSLKILEGINFFSPYRDSKPGSFAVSYEINLQINSGSILIVSYLITLE